MNAALALGFLGTGVTLGLSAGLSPGPLQTLVLAESLAGGWRRGAQVALAPLITDTYMITLSLFALGRLPERAFAVVEVVGGLVLLWYGYSTIRGAQLQAAPVGNPQPAGSPVGSQQRTGSPLGKSQPAGSPAVESGAAAAGQAPPLTWGSRWAPLRRGVVANLFNAHAYLFWLTAGGAIVTRAATAGWVSVTAFLVGFFTLLVGSKLALAALAARSRRFLAGTAYRAVLVALGLVLGGLGVRALSSGLTTLL